VQKSQKSKGDILLGLEGRKCARQESKDIRIQGARTDSYHATGEIKENNIMGEPTAK
jgi:hypothetical protein